MYSILAYKVWHMNKKMYHKFWLLFLLSFLVFPISLVCSDDEEQYLLWENSREQISENLTWNNTSTWLNNDFENEFDDVQQQLWWNITPQLNENNINWNEDFTEIEDNDQTASIQDTDLESNDDTDLSINSWWNQISRDNNNFLNSTFWSQNPSDEDIVHAIYWSEWDRSVYTMWWPQTCKNVNVVHITTNDWLPSNLTENTIYVLEVDEIQKSQTITFDECNSIVSNKNLWTTIYNVTTLTVSIGSSYWIIDSIQFKWWWNTAWWVYIVWWTYNTLNNIIVYGYKSPGIYLKDNSQYNKINNVCTYNDWSKVTRWPWLAFVNSSNNYVTNVVSYNNMDAWLQLNGWANNNVIKNLETYWNWRFWVFFWNWPINNVIIDLNSHNNPYWMYGWSTSNYYYWSISSENGNPLRLYTVEYWPQYVTSDCIITYDNTWLTNKDVVATLTWCSVDGWENDQEYVFTDNWTHDFEYKILSSFSFEINDMVNYALWNTWILTRIKTATVDWIDKESPICEVEYNITEKTLEDVVAVLTWCSEDILATDTTYTFTENWEYLFKFQDLAWNTWEKLAEVNRIYSVWWGWGYSLKKDKCPDGDFSDSYYDWDCWLPEDDVAESNPKQHWSAWENGESQEYYNAYIWAYNNWLLTKKQIDSNILNMNLTRIEMSRLLSNYAINILWDIPNYTREKDFYDVSNYLDSLYNNSVTKSYQLWIMWINIPDENFRPNDIVSNAEFITALSRMLYQTADWSDIYYSTHINLMRDLWVIVGEINPYSTEIFWDVLLILYRASVKQ